MSMSSPEFDRGSFRNNGGKNGSSFWLIVIAILVVAGLIIGIISLLKKLL